MTTYKSERGHKKLLVPVVALLLCAAAMVGLGYAALVSDVTNTGNVVAVDGLTATFTDDEGEGEDGLLNAGSFSAHAVIKYNNKQTNSSNIYTIDAQTLVLGEATLNIHVTDPDLEQVSISHAIDWTTGTPATAIETSLLVNGEVPGTTESGDLILNLTSAARGEDGQNFTLTLMGNVASSSTLTDKPDAELKYDITVYVKRITV